MGEMMFVVKRNPAHFFSPFVRTDWRWLLRRTWGARAKYPAYVEASLGLWVNWFRQELRSPKAYDVVHRTHTRRGRRAAKVAKAAGNAR
jgi:hypothetical protein